jgi:sortase A
MEPCERKLTMKLLGAIEILAWTVGISLLVTSAATRSWYAYGRDEGIETFSAVRRAVEAEAVDTSAWSRKRVARYRETLQARATPDAILAVLRIPSLKLAVPVFEGTSDQNLNRGAGRIEGTARIGEVGNVGIAAHRDGFFRALKDVQIGQTLVLERLDSTDRYRIVATTIVDPSDVSVLAATTTHSITLVTCYPFYYVGSAPQRFIVRAEKTPAGVIPAGDQGRVASEGGATNDGGESASTIRPDPD